MSWHCEDAALNWTELPAVRRKWHDIVARLREQQDVFDDWGMFAYTSARTGVDYLVEIDVGIWEQELDDETWALWVQAKRDIAAVASSTAARSAPATGRAARARSTSCPTELGGAYGVMESVKRTLDPEQRHEPGQVRARWRRSRRTANDGVPSR